MVGTWRPAKVNPPHYRTDVMEMLWWTSFNLDAFLFL